jgi:DNA-directed RNA polymerase subunit RPC12/RpoP
VDDERSGGNSTSTRCRYCGSDEGDMRSSELRERAATFQVIVACASCGAAFAALSRN